MSDAELERLRREAGELRALVRTLSARLAKAAAALPVEAAVALARGEDADAGAALALEAWEETIETRTADVVAEMDLLWKRIPPREGA